MPEKPKRKTWRNLLLDAADLIERTGWTKRALARIGRKEISLLDARTTCFCAMIRAIPGTCKECLFIWQLKTGG